MASDAPFRWTLLTMLLVTVAVVGYHRWLAAQSHERISRKDEGLLLAVSLRLAGACLWVTTLVFLINPEWTAWASLPLPDGLRWLGALLGALGCALMIWTLPNLGKNLTDTVMTRTDATLVITGPYRWVRHPFYVTVALLMPAALLLSANWFIGLSGLVVLALLVVRTGKEEQKLIERFGDDYRAYMARTGQFWPNLRPREPKLIERDRDD
jgi:protein-S-isoprenylcysteine O-methyltransferase Ste14